GSEDPGSEELDPDDPERSEREAEIEAFLALHVEHANDEDLSAYLGDFVPEHGNIDVIERHTARLFELYDFTLEIEGLNFEGLTQSNARVIADQRATKIDARGNASVDLSRV